jgi:hypothetical protein
MTAPLAHSRNAAIMPSVTAAAFPPGWDVATGGLSREAWPCGSFLALAPLTGAAACAALHARAVAAEWRLKPLVDTAGRTAAGMIASALRVSAHLPERPAVSLWLRSDGRRLLIGAGDASPEPPAAAGPECPLGEDVAIRYGWHEHRDGKVCWAVLSAARGFQQ